MEEKILIELSANYQKFEGAVGNIKRPLYGIVQVSHTWNSMLTEELKIIGFQQ